MQTFEIGKQYELEVIEIRQDNSGYDYLALRDETCDTYRIYNILKYQYEELPDKVTVIVKDLDPLGRPKLKQETASIYQSIYKFGEEYRFRVIDIKEDVCSPNKAEYYELEDEYCIHRHYFKTQKYQIGEECTMLVEGLTDNGDLRIKDLEKELGALKQETLNSPFDFKSKEESSVRVNTNNPILDLGEEGTTLEYKTSIVFKNGQPKIDDQLFVIVKTLVAFMNAEGGNLYIGIHDKTREVLGITGDYPYLNEGNDEYNGQYEPSIDKYQLKIRHALERLSQGVAEQLVEFDFPIEQGVQYCHIAVKKAKRPVWVNKNQLFQRTGNRITQLKQDEITHFVYERMQVSLKDVIDTEEVNNMSFSAEQLADLVKRVNNAHRASIAAPKPTINVDEVDYYIVWYNDGTWKRLRNVSTEKNVFYTLPVRKHETNNLLVFCYQSGTINEVELNVFKRGINLNRTAQNGFKPDEKPLNIYFANSGHFLAVYGVDSHAIEYVKVHRITDITPTKSARNQGSRIIPRNDKIQGYKLVPGDCEKKIYKLLFSKSKTLHPGITVDSPVNQEEIKFLNSLSLPF